MHRAERTYPAKRVSIPLLTILVFLSMSYGYTFAQSAPLKPDPEATQKLDNSAKTHEEKPISQIPSLFVLRFRFAGNTVFSQDELSAVSMPYENREITFEELQRLRRELTLFYVNRGYINSGAVIPDQTVKEETIKLRIIEGVLNSIEITGNRYFQAQYLKNRLRLAAGPVLNIINIQEALQLLQQDTRISKINAELQPGLMPGQSNLHVRIEENSPYRLSLEANNHLSTSVGKIRGEMHLSHQNLTGNGDILEGGFGFAEGLEDADMGYALPVNPQGTTLGFRYRKSNSTVIEDIFKTLDIKSSSKTHTCTLKHPYTWTPDKKGSMGLSLELRESQSSLLGRPFSFSPGTEEGKCNITVLRVSHEWVNRTKRHVIAARSYVSLGLDAFDSTVNEVGEDSRFVSCMGQFQWTRRLDLFDSQMIFRAAIQLADNPLLPLEKFAVGGMETVRGYRENLFVRDNGYVTSLELRIPVISYRRGEGEVCMVPFWDYGRSWNKGRHTPAPDSISSVGMGIRWRIIKHMDMEVYWGLRLRNVHDAKDDLQEKGIHFRFTVRIF